MASCWIFLKCIFFLEKCKFLLIGYSNKLHPVKAISNIKELVTGTCGFIVKYSGTLFVRDRST